MLGIYKFNRFEGTNYILIQQDEFGDSTTITKVINRCNRNDASTNTPIPGSAMELRDLVEHHLSADTKTSLRHQEDYKSDKLNIWPSLPDLPTTMTLPAKINSPDIHHGGPRPQPMQRLKMAKPRRAWHTGNLRAPRRFIVPK